MIAWQGTSDSDDSFVNGNRFGHKRVLMGRSVVYNGRAPSNHSSVGEHRPSNPTMSTDDLTRCLSFDTLLAPVRTKTSQPLEVWHLNRLLAN